MENGVHHLHKSIWETWLLWTLLVLGFLILFLLVFYFRNPNSAKRSKHEPSLENLPDQSPSVDEVKITIKTEEEMIKPSSSELVFFVEEEERFTLDELLEGPADMRTHGFCSSLYTVQLKNDVVLAVKRLKMLNLSSHDEFCRTMNVVGRLKHPNILPLVCYRSTPDEKLLVYQYQTNGSLLNLFEKYVERKREFPWKLRLSIGLDIARGLDFIYKKRDENHDNIIPHGNIKLSNIMLSDDDVASISEYGYAKFLDRASVCLFLKGYTAPEKELSEKADVYSFGVVLMELLTGKTVETSGLDLPRWVGSTVREEWTGEVFDKELSAEDELMYAFPMLNVSLKCVAFDPKERPTFAEVLEKIEDIVNSQ
ncbi:hypothetical protein ABFX02_13G159900 [Erythranthe guttata]